MQSARPAVDLAYAVRHLVARAALSRDAAAEARPLSDRLARIDAARAELAAMAGAGSPLAADPRHAEISEAGRGAGRAGRNA